MTDTLAQRELPDLPAPPARPVDLGHDLEWDPPMTVGNRWTCRTCSATAVVPPGQTGFGTAFTTGCVVREDRPARPALLVGLEPGRWMQTGITAQHLDGSRCQHQVTSGGKPIGIDVYECDGRAGHSASCACGLACRGPRKTIAAWKRFHAAAHKDGGLPESVHHAAQVQAEGERFRAVCLCGASWAGPTEPGCELEATRHLRTSLRTIRWQITPADKVEQPW